jgi:hypothetical protein
MVMIVITHARLDRGRTDARAPDRSPWSLPLRLAGQQAPTDLDDDYAADHQP